jgi:RNA polymerase sigma factor (sigma-70 family)
MPDQDQFLDLLFRVRSGDQDAAAELVRQIQPFILRVIRFKLRVRGPDDALRHEVGSMDVCQSVMASLFNGLKENRFNLSSPEKIRGLLRTMIQFNILSKARRQSVTKRKLVGPDEQDAWIDHAPGPEEAVIDNDRMVEFLDRLTEDELVLLRHRLEGKEWQEIAAELKQKPDALRKRLERGMERVERELNDRH